MSQGASTIFTARQLDGLRKLGDVILPPNGDFPGFSAVGCIDQIDALMGTAHSDDLRDAGWLLLIISYLPEFAIEWIVRLSDRAERWPKSIAPLFRMLNIAIKGMVFSLYYSGYHRATYQGKTGLDVIDYQVHCAPDQH